MRPKSILQISTPHRPRPPSFRHAAHRTGSIFASCERALHLGFRDVRGIEPSRDAVSQAKPSLRRHIIGDVMRPGIFKAGGFDAICMFHIFDHIPDPNELLLECLRIMKPRGFILALNHNVESWSARLLGERSPIIDIEHTFLYSPSTMRRIFEINGFEVMEQGGVWNTYSITYLFHLLPLPRRLKDVILYMLKASAFGRVPLRLPLGNLYLIAKKPKVPCIMSNPGETRGEPTAG